MSTKNIWIIAEKFDSLAELCAGGRLLGEKVTVFFPRTEEIADKAIKVGADKVYLLDQSGSPMLEDFKPAILNLLAQEKPSLLLMNNTKRAKLMAGRLAASLKTSVLTDVMELTSDLQAKRMVYGGAAIRTERSTSEIIIALVGSAVFEPLPEDSYRQGSIEVLAPISNPLIKRIETRQKQGESVNLAAAKRVVVVGRGLANQEDLKLVKELAGVMGAEVGCTRPIAEGVSWLPRERYIGVSGVMLKPDIYIGIGISGQVQHMVGVNQAKTIVAINKDKNAPIFKQSDYGIVGDLYSVVPKLIEKIKSGK